MCVYWHGFRSRVSVADYILATRKNTWTPESGVLWKEVKARGRDDRWNFRAKLLWQVRRLIRTNKTRSKLQLDALELFSHRTAYQLVQDWNQLAYFCAGHPKHKWRGNARLFSAKNYDKKFGDRIGLEQFPVTKTSKLFRSSSLWGRV